MNNGVYLVIGKHQSSSEVEIIDIFKSYSRAVEAQVIALNARNCGADVYIQVWIAPVDKDQLIKELHRV